MPPKSPSNPNQQKRTSLPPVEPLTDEQLRGGILAIQQVTASRGRSDISAAELMSWMQGQLDERADANQASDDDEKPALTPGEE